MEDEITIDVSLGLVDGVPAITLDGTVHVCRHPELFKQGTGSISPAEDAEALLLDIFDGEAGVLAAAAAVAPVIGADVPETAGQVASMSWMLAAVSCLPV